MSRPRKTKTKYDREIDECAALLVDAIFKNIELTEFEAFEARRALKPIAEVALATEWDDNPA